MISSLVRIAVGLSCEKKNALEALNDGARVGQIRGKLVAHASPAERDWRRGPRGANENSGALPGVAVDGTCPMADGELRAFDALASHAKLAELVAITRTLANAAAEAHKSAWTDADKVKAQAEELKLTSEDAVTTFGNALTVLERGP